ncbi:sugar ABC transporter substrate-binding protein [Candidatus Aerophobetes bacterium]|uniref:Sugar ABC transporter substrate-binding protein n=1 Tax=Aerophobetes bacterium TaxID=2030807 RepID=A0A523VXM8_UNCAE|nr:MAG: sugar ABC transporter substrate-binding protein [Candidatus Aerophobetes bacterium]
MKRYVKIVLSIVVMMALVVGLFGFVSISAAKAEKEYTFYIVSHGGPATPFWAVVMKGMRDAAERFGVKAIYAGPEKYSIAKLVDMLESAIAARPDGIAVTITAVEPLDEPLRRAIKLGIPVIATNVKDPRPPEEAIPYLCYVGTDQYLMGVYAARRLLKEFTPTRAVVGIQEVGHIGLETRARGFTDVLKKKGIPVEKIDITPDIAKGVEIYRSYLVRHPDTDAIFGVTMASAEVSVKLVEEEGLVGKVRLVNTDLSPTIIKAIKEDIMVSASEQQQYLQGYLPILYLYLYNTIGLCPTGDILTGPSIVDKTNVEMVEKTVGEGYR